MNTSYKIALVVAALLCVAVIVVSLSTPDTSTPVIEPGADEAQTLTSDENQTPTDGQVATESNDTMTADAAPGTTGPETLVIGRPPSLASVETRTARPPAADEPTSSAAMDIPATTSDDLNIIQRAISQASRKPSTSTQVKADEPAPSSTTTVQPDPIIRRLDARANTGVTIVTNPDRATYVVKQGDTLSSIAIDVLGSERHWVKLAEANPTVDPLRMRVGQVLKLPTAQELAASDQYIPPAPGEVKYHTVRSGDSLWKLALKFYGDGDQWRIIYNANRDQIGDNTDQLRAGMKLTIPPSPVIKAEQTR